MSYNKKEALVEKTRLKGRQEDGDGTGYGIRPYAIAQTRGMVINSYLEYLVIGRTSN